MEGSCGNRWPRILWAEFIRGVAPDSTHGGESLEGRQARRPACGTADEVRAGHQPENGKGAPADDSAVAAGASRSGDPVMDRRRFLLTSLAGVLAAPLAAEAQTAGRIA